MSLDVDVIADVIVQAIKAAIAPIADDHKKLRAEFELLRVEHADVKARLTALDVAEAPAVPFGPTVQ